MSLPAPHAAIPLAPRKFAQVEAQARTRIAQHMQRRRAVIAGMEWEFSVNPLAQAASREFGAIDWCVRAEWRGAPFELRLPAAAPDQWLRSKFASLDLPEIPAAVRAAALEEAMEETLAAIEAAGHGRMRIDTVEEAEALAPNLLQHHFVVSLWRTGTAVDATLSTDTLGLRVLSELAATWPAARDALDPNTVPIVLRASVGSAALTRAEIASLREGDAIVLQDSRFDEKGEIWLGRGRWGLRVREEHGHLVVSQPFHSTEQEMNEDFDEEPDSGYEDDFEPETAHRIPPAALTDLDALPVRIHFDLGQRILPLGELTALQVGQVLELDRPVSQAVNIRANGALIGTGELLEVGGRIAVGIVSLGTDRKERT